MQIEFSPIYGLMFGMNYAYYPQMEEQNAMHLIQIGLGLVIVQIAWEE
jgi:hypothetical protein